jgi:hypothetical protein
MDKQRIYDAMLIKAFRADKTLGMLWYWLKVYKMDIPEEGLKRQPPRIPMRVQVFVGSFMKPLADRLWDTDKAHDIKTLDWMTNLECQATDRISQNERKLIKRKSRADRRRTAFLRENIEAQNTGNQWAVTKGRSKQRR